MALSSILMSEMTLEQMKQLAGKTRTKGAKRKEDAVLADLKQLQASALAKFAGAAATEFDAGRYP